MSNILTLHLGHNGSISISKNNNLIVHTELERYNKKKFSDEFTQNLIEKINNLNILFDLIVVSHWCQENDFYENSVDKKKESYNFLNLINKSNNCKVIFENCNKPHHYYHLLSSMYNLNKKFDFAIIMDGNGKYFNGKLEQISIFDKDKNCVYKQVFTQFDGSKTVKLFENDMSVGLAYQTICLAYGFNCLESGKLMALSDYGKINHNIFKNLKNFNREHFKYKLGDNGEVDAQSWFPNLTLNKNDKHSLNFATSFQKVCEHYVLNIFKKYKNKNILLSGGVFQNVLINTLLSKKSTQNVYVDPMCNDQGISLGMMYHYTNFKLKRKNTYYLGFKPDYSKLKNIFKNYSIEKCTYDDVSKILINDPVALFQGKSEQGQRGLGNRSLLMNVNNKYCFEKINDIKKREWFRPFACSILNEDLKKWFTVDNKRCPYYMTFLFEVNKNKKNILKKVLSIKNTCRLQSVKKEHNINFYNLLKCFKKNTGFPFLLNTSLNMKGQTIVEDLNDLKIILENTSLKYIWLPDLKKIIKKNDKF
jgi:carbamoyltransferase